MASSKKANGPCPSCVFREYYNKDGSFAAIVDYQNEPELFALHVRGFVGYIMTTEFDNGVGVRVKQRRYKSYLKTALGLIGCPDVAEIMDKDANTAKRLLEHRFADLLHWHEGDLHGDEKNYKRIAETLRRWKEQAPDYQRGLIASSAVLELVK